MTTSASLFSRDSNISPQLRIYRASMNASIVTQNKLLQLNFSQYPPKCLKIVIDPSLPFPVFFCTDFWIVHVKQKTSWQQTLTYIHNFSHLAKTLLWPCNANIVNRLILQTSRWITIVRKTSIFGSFFYKKL